MPPEPMHKPPAPPHLHEPPRPPHELHEAPHERKKRFWGKRIAISVLTGIVVTAVVSIALWAAGISVNVILPVAAPVWAGSTSLVWGALGDRIG